MPGHKNQREHASSGSAATVVQIFEKIAAILLRIGFDAPRSEQMLRRAFISSATKVSRTSGKRSTQSQIALVAGVSRLEVRKILLSQHRKSLAEEKKGQSRVDRILGAWRQDPKFSNGLGRPKSLTFIGANTQFESLVRKYGRDVTVRTLREDLIKNNLVIVNGNRLTLVDQKKSKDRRQPSALSDLNSLYSYLSLLDFERGRRISTMRNLILPADDAKTLRLIQSKSVAKLEVALSSLDSLKRVHPERAKRSRGTRSHRLLITATVAAETVDDS